MFKKLLIISILIGSCFLLPLSLLAEQKSCDQILKECKNEERQEFFECLYEYCEKKACKEAQVVMGDPKYEVIHKLPTLHDDWLICMVSSQLSQQVPEFDEVIKEEDTDFLQSGLKTSSVVRITRLAVVNKIVLLGSIGNIGAERLVSIKKNYQNG